MKEMVRMIAALSVICLFSGAFLSFLKGYTAPLIEAQELALVQGPVIRTIFPKITNDPITERVKMKGSQFVVFPIKDDGKLIGVAMEGVSAGYGGDLGTMVGINVQNDTIVGVGTTLFKETPGYGSRVNEDPSFAKQFAGLKTSQNIAPGSGVQTLSGATVSSTAYISNVSKVLDFYKKNKDTILQEIGMGR